MKSWAPDGKIDAKGFDDLGKPLLHTQEDDDTPLRHGVLTPQINDIKSFDSKIKRSLKSIMVSPIRANSVNVSRQHSYKCNLLTYIHNSLQV